MDMHPDNGGGEMITVSDTTYCLGVWHGIMPGTGSVFSMWVTHEPAGPWTAYLDVVNSVRSVKGKRVTIDVNDEDAILECCRRSIKTMGLSDCEEILIRVTGNRAIMLTLAAAESKYMEVHFIGVANDGTIN